MMIRHGTISMDGKLRRRLDKALTELDERGPRHSAGGRCREAGRARAKLRGDEAYPH